MLRHATYAILAGVVILHYSPQLPPYWLFWFTPVLLVLLVVLKSSLARLIIIGMLGFSWAFFQAAMLLEHRLPDEFISKDITVSGHVASLPKRDARKTRFEFDIEEVIGLGPDIAPTKVRLSWYQNQTSPNLKELSVGDKWQFTIRLKPPRNFANPGAFNYSGWLLQKKILSTGYIRNNPEPRLLAKDRFSYPLQRLRQAIRNRLAHSGLDENVEPFLRALIIGDRADLKTEDWRVLKNTGTVHLMAISGLHVGLIAGLTFTLARWFWSVFPFLALRFAAPRAAAIFAWLAAAGYAGLAGFSLPTQRALIMLSIVLFTVIVTKPIRPGQVLSLALLAVLLLDSFAVLSVSFWLSFGAVGLIYYSIYLQSRDRHRLNRWITLQLIISLGLLPLTVHFFQQASVISPLANLIAVPVVGFVIVPMCFLGVAALFLLPSLGMQVLSLTAYVFQLLLEILKWFAELPFSHLTFATPGWLTLILAVSGFLLLLLPRVLKARILALFCIIPLLFPFHAQPEKGEAEVTVLDVGQGLAVVVQTAQHAMVYDAGPRFSQYFDTGRAVVIPYLNDKGIRQVDTLLISHGDNDHIGGAKSILEALQVEGIITSVPEKFSFSKTKRCQRGQTWNWDTVKIEVLHPDILDYVNGYSENNLSCVIKITTRSQSFLLTGDIEVEAETLLLERYADYLRSDTLIAPHHGSNSSSSSQFLAVVRPGRVIVPAGWRNRYRFPHGDVLERYARHNIKVLITAQQGAITMHSGSKKTSSFREQNRYYWERYNE